VIDEIELDGYCCVVGVVDRLGIYNRLRIDVIVVDIIRGDVTTIGILTTGDKLFTATPLTTALL
jgi:hypothetical protein